MIENWSIEANRREETKEERLTRERKLAEEKAEQYVFNTLDNCWFALCKRMREDPTAETQKAMNMVRRVIEETKRKFRSDKADAEKDPISTDEWVRWLKAEDCIMDYPEAALDVSERILMIAAEEKFDISNPCLQWLLFEINKTCKEKLGKYLFPNIFTVDGFGPRYDIVYYNFCGFGALPITLYPSSFNEFVLIRKDAYEIIETVIREEGGSNLSELCKKHMDEFREAVDKKSTETWEG